MAKKQSNSEPVILPATHEITVIGTGNSIFIKEGKEFVVSRNVAEKLIKKGSVILKQ